MTRQVEMFPPAPSTADERLNAAQAELRLEAMSRAETRPRGASRHHQSVATRCPSCGSCVTIRVK